MEYLAVFEHGKEANSYGAYVPDLPGCRLINSFLGFSDGSVDI